MQQSNAYIIVFSIITTIILGGLLSVASVGLGPRQKIQVELDTKKKYSRSCHGYTEVG